MGIRKRNRLLNLNARHARILWGAIPEMAMSILFAISRRHQLSVAAGDLQLLDGRWYITHSGLLRIAQRRHCAGIETTLQRSLCDVSLNRWVFKAIVYNEAGGKGFVGYGDADPSNTSPLVRGSELRVAETRAVNRALRKAYGIGLCSVEELGSRAESSGSGTNGTPERKSESTAAPHNGQPRLRDKLCLLIRHFNLDASLVKAYAADFCGTETLRGASRELVESFITQIEKEARTNRDQLVCKLNSYSHPVEVQS